MLVTAKAPCRVDLAGGTLDIWPLYLHHAGAVTVNFAIDIYTSCRLRTRRDARIVLRSKDLGVEESFDSLDDMVAARRYRLPLAAFVLRFFRPRTGLDVEMLSEAPAGAGIAGSSALIIALASALNRLTGSGYSLEKLREIAQNIEAQIIRVPTGAQDYYPAMYGGVSAIELRVDGIRRSAILVAPDELNERFVLAYTGEPRFSGINNWEVTKAHIDGSAKVRRNFDQIAAIAGAMRSALEASDWNGAGLLLRREWTHRRANVPTIATPLIDRMIAATRGAGAIGAKVCGAGGGGCVFFLVRKGARDKVAETITLCGAKVLEANLAPHGVRVAASRR